ncbi:MAG: dTMP kinase [Bdellovibrionales bacterium]|nr:dTMP kinase [Bdellovibrionales bacterium]
MKFIVFEGLDGAGKTTLINQVKTYLETSQMSCVFVRDPGGTVLSEKLRHLILDPDGRPVPKAELLMYEASRTQLVHEIIQPSLAQKKWVLSDRFYSSTIAFQSQARGLERKDIDWLNHYACNGIVPDLVIFIDIPVEESQRRLQQRTAATNTKHDRMENENKQFHERVRKGYLLQAEENPKGWLVLDGMQTPEQLFKIVQNDFKGRQWLS